MNREQYRLTKEIFVERSNKIHNNKYDYSESNYKNQREPIDIICPIHGKFKQTPKRHMIGQGCPKCGAEYAKMWRKNDWEHFIEESKKRFGECYDFPNIKNEYENSHSKITFKCKVCGNEFIKIACDHLTSPNGGCSHYEKLPSKLENEIEQFLVEKGIDYIRQKKFNWLGQLEVDFFIPNNNIAIECQGRQHFEEVDWFGGCEGLYKTIKRDKLKKKLCEQNDVKVLYYSNLGINYPYKVFEDKEELLKEIKNE